MRALFSHIQKSLSIIILIEKAPSFYEKKKKNVGYGRSR